MRVRARLALVLANLPATRMGEFLSDAVVSPALAEAVAAGLLQPGPQVRFSNMADLHWRTGFDLWKTVPLVLLAVRFGLVARGSAQAPIGFFAAPARW